MNAETALTEAYQEWRRLAETEGDAIRSCNWGLLAASQRALEHLRDRITALTVTAKKEWVQFGADITSRENKFRAIIADLMQLERQNSTLLTAIRQGVKTQLDKLDQSGRNLKRVHRSYAPARSPVWTSFS
jgi:flagellar biosynthesis regulator FlaF